MKFSCWLIIYFFLPSPCPIFNSFVTPSHFFHRGAIILLLSLFPYYFSSFFLFCFCWKGRKMYWYMVEKNWRIQNNFVKSYFISNLFYSSVTNSLIFFMFWSYQCLVSCRYVCTYTCTYINRRKTFFEVLFIASPPHYLSFNNEEEIHST